LYGDEVSRIGLLHIFNAEMVSMVLANSLRMPSRFLTVGCLDMGINTAGKTTRAAFGSAGYHNRAACGYRDFGAIHIGNQVVIYTYAVGKQLVVQV
jgi:hypothetical protein